MRFYYYIPKKAKVNEGSHEKGRVFLHFLWKQSKMGHSYGNELVTYEF